MSKTAAKKWSVWVGGVEVNDYYLTKEHAQDIAFDYVDDDYDDVVIMDTDGNEERVTKVTS